jgi:hypothetical protein
MTHRSELLILPRFAACGDHIARELSRSLPQARIDRYECAAWTIWVLSAGLSRHQSGGPRDEFEHREGPWPEAPGMRLRGSQSSHDPSWCVEVDCLGLRPIHYGFDNRRRIIVSTRPDLIAALIGSELSTRALAELLLVGFFPDDHSMFDGVHRLRPGEWIGFDVHQGLRTGARSQASGASHEFSGSASDCIDALRESVARSFERGHMLELSGGVDSRLVLALGLSAGSKPATALTIGDGGSEDADVEIARRICRTMGIDHIVQQAEAEQADVVEDGRLFAMQSGFAVNACSYAWLPGVFRRLDGRRSGQIGGGGGECAGGFYYTPLDGFCRFEPFSRAWIRRRFLHAGIAIAELFGREIARELRTDIERHLLSLIDRQSHWRAAMDELYRAQRLPHTAGPVLSASAAWYEPYHPLLTQPYHQWATCLSIADRHHRRAQRDLIGQLAPSLAKIPFAGQSMLSATPLKRAFGIAENCRRTISKIHRRVRSARKSPDLGAAITATRFASDDASRLTLLEAADSVAFPPRRQALDAILEQPATYAHELGALMTAAWAAREVRDLSRELARDRDTIVPRIGWGTAPDRTAA